MAKLIGGDSTKDNLKGWANRAHDNSLQFSVNKPPKRKGQPSLPTAGAASGVGREQKAGK